MKAYVWADRKKRAVYSDTSRRYAMDLRRDQVKSGARLTRLRVVDFGKARPSGGNQYGEATFHD